VIEQVGDGGKTYWLGETFVSNGEFKW